MATPTYGFTDDKVDTVSTITAAEWNRAVKILDNQPQGLFRLIREGTITGGTFVSTTGLTVNIAAWDGIIQTAADKWITAKDSATRTVTLSASTTSYIYATATGTGDESGGITYTSTGSATPALGTEPILKAVTSGSAITSYTDIRRFAQRRLMFKSWQPQEVDIPATNSANRGILGSSTNSVETVEFENSGTPTIELTLLAPAPDITLYVHWTSSATSGNAVWCTSFKSGGDYTAAYPTDVEVTDAAPSSANNLEKIALPITGLLPDTVTKIRLRRDTADGSDTMAASAHVLLITAEA